MRKNALIISSNKIGSDKFIPAEYTVNGKNVNPPLLIKNLPVKAKSIAIIMLDVVEDDAVHWLAYNIPAKGLIRENEKNCALGLNGFNKRDYSGPKPNGSKHNYVFKVYALDDFLYFPHQYVSRKDVEEGIRYHLVGYGELKAACESLAAYSLV